MCRGDFSHKNMTKYWDQTPTYRRSMKRSTSSSILVLAELAQYMGCVSIVEPQRTAIRAQVSFEILELPCRPKPKPKLRPDCFQSNYSFFLIFLQAVLSCLVIE